MSLKINLDDRKWSLKLAPHTLTKPMSELLVGLFKNSKRYLNLDDTLSIGYLTTEHLAKKYNPLTAGITVCSSVIPNLEFIQYLRLLKQNEALRYKSEIIACIGEPNNIIEYSGQELQQITSRWDLFQKNSSILASDFQYVTEKRESEPLPDHCTLIGNPNQLFIEKGAIITAAILNVQTGPIYIGRDTEVMEGSLIRGPFCLQDFSHVKMGSKIYGATSIGPHCKVGGELNNVIFESYSNKAHDGFIGNGYIGSWCNIGADTNASNLMNNYGLIDAYSYEIGKIIPTGQQFIGLCMGDYSKCGINSMFNTATVVGVACNVFGSGFFKKHIPSFSFGEPLRMFPYRFDKAIEGIESMMVRRNQTLDEEESNILKFIFEKQDSF